MADDVTLRGEVPPPAGDLGAWIAARAAALLDVPPDRVRADLPLVEQGLDSVSAVALVAEIEDRLQVELDSDLLWDHPAVDDLVGFLTRSRDAAAAS